MYLSTCLHLSTNISSYLQWGVQIVCELLITSAYYFSHLGYHELFVNSTLTFVNKVNKYIKQQINKKIKLIYLHFDEGMFYQGAYKNHIFCISKVFHHGLLDSFSFHYFYLHLQLDLYYYVQLFLFLYIYGNWTSTIMFNSSSSSIYMALPE